jgi:hypothetical protein
MDGSDFLGFPEVPPRLLAGRAPCGPGAAPEYKRARRCGREFANGSVAARGYWPGVEVASAVVVADEVAVGGGGVGWVGGASTVGGSTMTVRVEVEVPAAFSAT